MRPRAKLFLALSLPVQIIVLKIISFFPEWVDSFYSNGIYKYSSQLFRYVFGWLPFSFGDIGYLILIIAIILYFYHLIKRKEKRIKTIIIEITGAISVAYAFFHLTWGLNYYRLPLHEILSLNDEYTQEELIKVSNLLITKANILHTKLETNDSLAIRIPYTKEEVFDKTIPAYKQVKRIFPELDYQPISIKKSLISLPLTYMGFSGYLNPITNEAQVNDLILDYKAPTTTCHEVAHQLGFAKENEANFIGAVTAMNYDDIYFQYSGVTFALRFCLNDLFFKDEGETYCLLEKLRPGIRKNYQEVNEFWIAYENPLEPIFKSTYDSYLKANNQPDGMKTYSYVVALLVNYFKNDHSIEL